MANQDQQPVTKKERKEALKNLRQQQETSSKRGGLLKTGAILLVVALVVGGIIFLFTRPPKKEVEIGQKFPEVSRQHIAESAKLTLEYNSNPPTSGQHWATPATCKVYSEEVPDGAAIHSLEHGAIWISYKDKNNTGLVKQLTDLVNGAGGKVLLSPRSKNDSAIAVAAWTRLLKLENFDEKQISDFIRAYKNTGPEPLGSC